MDFHGIFLLIEKSCGNFRLVLPAKKAADFTSVGIVGPASLAPREILCHRIHHPQGHSSPLPRWLFLYRKCFISFWSFQEGGGCVLKRLSENQELWFFIIISYIVSHHVFNYLKKIFFALLTHHQIFLV